MDLEVSTDTSESEHLVVKTYILVVTATYTDANLATEIFFFV